MRDHKSALKTVLEQAGFEEIEIEELKIPPKHVIDWAKGDDDEMTDEEVATVILYLKIKTSIGEFGIVVGVYHLLDIHGSGCNLDDFGLESGAGDNPHLVQSNTRTLHLLKVKMRKNKISKSEH